MGCSYVKLDQLDQTGTSPQQIVLSISYILCTIQTFTTQLCILYMYCIVWTPLVNVAYLLLLLAYLLTYYRLVWRV